jgi:hypothetical protein
VRTGAGARDASLPLIRLGPALVLAGLLLCAPGEMAGFAMMALAVDMLAMAIHGSARPWAWCCTACAWWAWRWQRHGAPLRRAQRDRIVTLRGLLDLTTGGVVMALPLALADAALAHGRHGVSAANLLFGHIGPIVLGVVTLLPLVLMPRREREQETPRRHAPGPLRALLHLFPAMLVSVNFVWPTPVLAILMPVAVATVTLELTLRETLLSMMLAAMAGTALGALGMHG